MRGKTLMRITSAPTMSELSLVAQRREHFQRDATDRRKYFVARRFFPAVLELISRRVCLIEHAPFFRRQVQCVSECLKNNVPVLPRAIASAAKRSERQGVCCVVEQIEASFS